MIKLKVNKRAACVDQSGAILRLPLFAGPKLLGLTWKKSKIKIPRAFAQKPKQKSSGKVAIHRKNGKKRA